LKTIAIAQIIIPTDRQRKEFDAQHLADLAADFHTEIGLLQPIILRNDGRTLVGGECRLRAANICAQQSYPIRHNGEVLPLGHIAYVTLAELSPANLRKAELHENTRRKNLSVVEEARAIAEYQALRRADEPEVTARQLVAEIYPDTPDASTTEVIRDSEIIARHSALPEVANAKSKAEALRAIRRSVNSDLNSALGALAIQEYTGEHTNLKGDARDVLPTLPSNTFSCICTDPPYGIGADKFGPCQEQAHKYDDSADYFHDIMSKAATEFYRVATEQAHLYLFCDPRHFEVISDLLSDAGWDVWKRPLIWHKSVGPAAGVGILPRPEHGPRNTYDFVLFANKGDRKVTGVYPDVIGNCPRVTQSGHPAEKPVSVYIELLRRSCNPGDQVLDAFAGSGPIFPAANLLHLTATAINLTEEDYLLAGSRLTEQYLKDLI
jgi:site-specific DNA-methyltransferase (adenine-specific)